MSMDSAAALRDGAAAASSARQVASSTMRIHPNVPNVCGGVAAVFIVPSYRGLHGPESLWLRVATVGQHEPGDGQAENSSGINSGTALALRWMSLERKEIPPARAR